jgi:hypothetical protein
MLAEPEPNIKLLRQPPLETQTLRDIIVFSKIQLSKSFYFCPLFGFLLCLSVLFGQALLGLFGQLVE